jgi:hypothetical protein
MPLLSASWLCDITEKWVVVGFYGGDECQYTSRRRLKEEVGMHIYDALKLWASPHEEPRGVKGQRPSRRSSPGLGTDVFIEDDD